jgi:hypothetical protein
MFQRATRSICDCPFVLLSTVAVLLRNGRWPTPIVLTAQRSQGRRGTGQWDTGITTAHLRSVSLRPITTNDFAENCREPFQFPAKNLKGMFGNIVFLEFLDNTFLKFPLYFMQWGVCLFYWIFWFKNRSIVNTMVFLEYLNLYSNLKFSSLD